MITYVVSHPTLCRHTDWLILSLLKFGAIKVQLVFLNELLLMHVLKAMANIQVSHRFQIVGTILKLLES